MNETNRFPFHGSSPLDPKKISDYFNLVKRYRGYLDAGIPVTLNHKPISPEELAARIVVSENTTYMEDPISDDSGVVVRMNLDDFPSDDLNKDLKGGRQEPREPRRPRRK